jgi:hypothetical protein
MGEGNGGVEGSVNDRVLGCMIWKEEYIADVSHTHEESRNSLKITGVCHNYSFLCYFFLKTYLYFRSLVAHL